MTITKKEVTEEISEAIWTWIWNQNPVEETDEELCDWHNELCTDYENGEFDLDNEFDS